MDKDIVIGQEAICPDGLGRVEEFDADKDLTITVRTYINNISSTYDYRNVDLIQLLRVKD